MMMWLLENHVLLLRCDDNVAVRESCLMTEM